MDRQSAFGAGVIAVGLVIGIVTVVPIVVTSSHDQANVITRRADIIIAIGQVDPGPHIEGLGIIASLKFEPDEFPSIVGGRRGKVANKGGNSLHVGNVREKQLA